MSSFLLRGHILVILEVCGRTSVGMNLVLISFVTLSCKGLGFHSQSDQNSQ